MKPSDEEKFEKERDVEIERFLLLWWPRDKDFMTDEWVKHRSSYSEYFKMLQKSMNWTRDYFKAEIERRDKAIAIMKDGLIDCEMNTRPERKAPIETRINIIGIDAKSALNRAKAILEGKDD